MPGAAPGVDGNGLPAGRAVGNRSLDTGLRVGWGGGVGEKCQPHRLAYSPSELVEDYRPVSTTLSTIIPCLSIHPQLFRNLDKHNIGQHFATAWGAVRWLGQLGGRQEDGWVVLDII